MRVEDFHLWVRQMRERHELSQSALGRRIGMNQVSLARIEAGERPVRLVEAVRIAHAFGHRALPRFASEDSLKCPTCLDEAFFGFTCNECGLGSPALPTDTPDTRSPAGSSPALQRQRAG